MAYILLFFFLFNSVGYYFIFELYKYHVKKELQTVAAKGSADLTILMITDPDHDREFQRIEKKEIRFKGFLYDVIKEVQSGRTTLFYCIHDRKEENLLATMNTVNNSKFLLSLWQHLIKIAVPPVSVALMDQSPVKILFPHISFKLSSVLLGTWSPPPELS